MAANPPDELDKLLEEWLEEHRAKKEWDKEHTYVIDMIKILHGRKWDS
jgi:hypothetical protein